MKPQASNLMMMVRNGVAVPLLGVLFSYSGVQAQEGGTEMAGPTHGLVSISSKIPGLPTLEDPNFSYFQAKSFLIKLCVSKEDVQTVLNKMEPGRFHATPFPPCGDDGKATLLGLDAAVDRVFDFGDAEGGTAIVGPTSRLLVFGLGTDTKGTESPDDDANGLLHLAVYTPAPEHINQALGVSGVARSAAINWRIEADSGSGTNQAIYRVKGGDGFAVDMHLEWPMDPADKRAPVKSDVRKGAGSPRIYFAGNTTGEHHPSIEFEYVRNRLDIRPSDFQVEVLPSDQLRLAHGDISIRKTLGASVTQNQESLIKVYPDDAP
jgi:hypothetical protein